MPNKLQTPTNNRNMKMDMEVSNQEIFDYYNPDNTFDPNNRKRVTHQVRDLGRWRDETPSSLKNSIFIVGEKL